MQGDVVLLFMATGVHAQAHVVAGIGAQQRGERVARLGASRVDMRREQRSAASGANRRGDRRWRQVHRRNGTVGTALHGERQVTTVAVGLHAALAVRCDLVGVVYAQGQRFVTVVDDEHARVIHRDRLRARPRRASREQATAGLDHRF
ncbi:hypothetical protein D9M71_561440 [compost metagenome]